MEMPTPCEKCSEIFDLNDGYGSQKWFPNITICSECHSEEEREIEEDDRWEQINADIDNALFGLINESDLKERISKENRERIVDLFNKFNNPD